MAGYLLEKVPLSDVFSTEKARLICFNMVVFLIVLIHCDPVITIWNVISQCALHELLELSCPGYQMNTPNTTTAMVQCHNDLSSPK